MLGYKYRTYVFVTDTPRFTFPVDCEFTFDADTGDKQLQLFTSYTIYNSLKQTK